ncbi:MAG: hypothetical protein LBF54_04440 [Holosporaceae bacterium]|nr:hypothetical protein [Holosporaceae bacterium]
MHRALFICLVLSGCFNKSTEICPVAQSHAEKLRRHFRGEKTEDISTLISETRAISARLKQSCMKEQANKFDSYIDVLTYGNRTIDESLGDVMKLTKHKKNDVCGCNLF